MKLRPTGPTFGLTLRGMLIITALLAVGMAFVGTKVNRARNEQAIALEIGKPYGTVIRQYYGTNVSHVERTWFERLIDLDLEARITQVYLNGPAVTDADIERLAALTDLQHIGLMNSRLDGTSLAALERLPNLTSLDLHNVALRGPGLAAISQLPVLRNLSIDYLGIGLPPPFPGESAAQLEPDELLPLKKLKSLQQLSLGAAGFSDFQYHELRGMDQLEDLQLSSATFLTDDGLVEMLTGMTGLRSLTITDASITGPGLTRLRDCPQLATLRLGCGLTEEGLKNIAQARQLLYLELGSKFGPTSSFTNQGVLYIASLPHLTRLTLHGTAFDDETLHQLAGLTSLVDLTLYAPTTAFTDQGLEHLKSLKNLKYVTLQGATSFSKAALDDLQRAIPGVTVQP
jgi:hypothetical protein